MGSHWVYTMTDKAWMVILPIRTMKNMISLPLNTFIIYKLFNHPVVVTLIREKRL